MRIMLIFLMVATLIINPGTAYSEEQQGSSKISLDIKGMDILDVFKIFAMRSDLNIIAGRNVRGNVTMFLKNVDIWDAFEIILTANDLAYEKRGDIINVMTQRDYELLYGEKYQDRREVKTIKLKYARVEDVSATLNQIKTNIGKVVADAPSKTLVIMDIPHKIKEMEDVVKSLDTPVVTKVYDLQYATAADIKDKIAEVLTKNIGSIQIDERTNKIVITDTEKKISGYDKVIAAFDEKHKVVEIEAMILELSLNDEYRMGINWDLAFQQLSDTLSNKLGDQIFGANFAELGSEVIPASRKNQTGFAYRIGDLGTKGFQAIIQFLQTYGRTQILSNPRITVLNNEEAKILVGTNQPYVTTTVSQGETTSQTAASVTFIDLGVKLYVTPTINNDGYITMKVKPEVSSQADTPLTYTVSGDSNEIPIVTTSTTETTVMVKDRHSIMLSGLIQKRDEEEIEKTPFLGDIPILGAFFRNERRGSATEPERKEIIIFITPRIVHTDDETIGEKVKEQRDAEEVEKQVRKKMQKLEKELPAAPEIEEDILTWREEMSRDAYYRLIWEQVHNKINENKPGKPIPCDISVSFMLLADGTLAQDPEVFAFADTDIRMVKIALNSIEEAAPFPKFPSTIQKNIETFNINITYK